MRAAILAVGSELLGSQRLDTNSLRLTAALERHGIELCRKAVGGDDPRELQRLCEEMVAAAELLLVTGGLGPTADDLTREAVAAALGRGLETRPEIVTALEQRFASFGLEMPAVNRRQAEVIAGAEALDNRRGTAPGQRIDHERGTIFLFPGVPHELEAMIEAYLEPWLAEHGGDPEPRQLLRVACVPESAAEEMLEPVYREFGRRPIALLASAGELQIRLSARGRAAAPGRLEELAARVEEAMGATVFGRSEEEPLEAVVGQLLAAAGRSVATAESCTGGLVAELLTRVAGSSGWFVGAAVTYADRLKTELLGVEPELLAAHGAVSREVAEAMARGVRERLGADYGVATTGIAGPGGGSEAKPLGTVHIAVAGPGGGGPSHRQVRLPGDRARVRRLTAQWALDQLRRRLLGLAPDVPGR